MGVSTVLQNYLGMMPLVVMATTKDNNETHMVNAELSASFSYQLFAGRKCSVY
ncbi:MAG: hypothetical protein ACL7AX_13465 [Candidatus Arsenophonus phytopathogenicus]